MESSNNLLCKGEIFARIGNEDVELLIRPGAVFRHAHPQISCAPYGLVSHHQAAMGKWRSHLACCRFCGFGIDAPGWSSTESCPTPCTAEISCFAPNGSELVQEVVRSGRGTPRRRSKECKTPWPTSRSRPSAGASPRHENSTVWDRTSGSAARPDTESRM